jgi:predicted acylesterase/phospholipase RssA
MIKPTVSLVLSSGGARGYAHIGAIEELIAQGFDIRSNFASCASDAVPQCCIAVIPSATTVYTMCSLSAAATSI